MRSGVTRALLRSGYRWGDAVRQGKPAVPARMLGRPAVAVGGPTGVRRFYDPRLRRAGAVPAPIRLVLFGPGTVHGLDESAHHHRKRLFLEILTPDAVADVRERAGRAWSSITADWPAGPIDIFDQAVQVFGMAVLPWSGVDLPAPTAVARGRQLATIVDGFGRPGPPMLRAAVARARLQLWARSLVLQTRRQQLHPASDSALGLAASATDDAGRRLPALTAATEFLNIVRPTVAVAWFVVFAAHALAEHPDWRERIAAGDVAATTAFAQEVRRTTPFAPALAARARQQQDVLGCPLAKGGYVVLDVFGTLHDPSSWPDPERFDPGRFERPFDTDALVPQGGGDTATGHRCPGEPLARTLLEQALTVLAGRPECLPVGPAQVNLRQMPPRP